MIADLDALLTALYVVVDDFLDERKSPGRKPRLSDSELICLAVAQVLLGFENERHWLRAVKWRLGHLFPYVCKQPGYNKRLRRLAPQICAVMRHLAVLAPSLFDQFRLVDSTPVPCGQSRETVKRSELAGYAAYGYCASHSRWFWGFRLYMIATPDGMPVDFALAPANEPEREVVAAMLDRKPLSSGKTLIADKGFAGKEFEELMTSMGVDFRRPDRKGDVPRFGKLGAVRQWIEAIFDTIKGQLSLERHGGRTLQGFFVRVAQRLCALAAAVWFNWEIGAPVKRSLIAYDH